MTGTERAKAELEFAGFDVISIDDRRITLRRPNRPEFFLMRWADSPAAQLVVEAVRFSKWMETQKAREGRGTPNLHAVEHQ